MKFTFDEIESFREPLRRIAHAIVNDFHDAEDVVHEVFCEAMTALDEIDDLEAWLKRCVANRSCDVLKSGRRRFVKLDFREELWPVLSEGHEYFGKHVSEQVFSVLERLSPEHRILLLEKSYGESDRVELCEKYGVSLSTLKRGIDQAREAFRKIWLEQRR